MLWNPAYFPPNNSVKTLLEYHIGLTDLWSVQVLHEHTLKMLMILGDLGSMPT